MNSVEPFEWPPKRAVDRSRVVAKTHSDPGPTGPTISRVPLTPAASDDHAGQNSAGGRREPEFADTDFRDDDWPTETPEDQPSARPESAVVPQDAHRPTAVSNGAPRRPAVNGVPSIWIALALALVTVIAVAEAAVIVVNTRQAGKVHDSPAVSTGASPRAVPPLAVQPIAVQPIAPAEIVQQAPPTAVSPAPATKGTLVIQSEPTGATVSVDDRALGVTPLTLSNVVLGTHRIVLRRGEAESRQVVRVSAGEALTVMALLTTPAQASGWVTVTSPFEVDITERGELIGTSRSPRVMLPAGQHTVELSSATFGYKDSLSVSVAAGQVTTLRVSTPPTVMNVNAVPWAEIWLDGKRVGETPIGNLSVAVGEHRVLFRHPELGEKTITALVRVGTPTRVTADMRAR